MDRKEVANSQLPVTSKSMSALDSLRSLRVSAPARTARTMREGLEEERHAAAVSIAGGTSATSPSSLGVSRKCRPDLCVVRRPERGIVLPQASLLRICEISD